MPASKEPVNKPALADALASKKRLRDKLSHLPFEEKISLVIRMQERAAGILAARGISRPVWKFPSH